MAQIKSRMIVVAGILAVVTLAAGAEAAWCQTEKEIRGLPNFGRVTDMLYRGGQPALAGFSALQAMGVGIVVNFRDEGAEMATEKRQVESLGIEYIGIPWSGHDEPGTSSDNTSALYRQRSQDSTKKVNRSWLPDWSHCGPSTTRQRMEARESKRSIWMSEPFVARVA